MSWKSHRKRTNPVTNNSWTRAKSVIDPIKGDDSASSSDAARSEAATNQDPNKNRSRQGGSAQIDYYGTEEAS